MATAFDTDPLDEFGRFLMTHLRDSGIDRIDRLLAAQWKTAALQKIQGELGALTAEQRALVRRAFVTSLDSAIHDFLFALQDQADRVGRIDVTVGGQNIAKLDSPGLQYEIFSEDGWRARFSEYGEPPEEA
jgi:hypothetical protein